MERDERATHPPADSEPERTPTPEGEERPSDDPVEGPGPRGNPAVDEEALRRKQEEKERADG
jgi:hypothetical protein